MSALPLDGIKVLTLEQVHALPWGTAFLADLGARVIREAIVRRECAEESGRRPNRIALEISRLPRRLGYHIGPE